MVMVISLTLAAGLMGWICTDFGHVLRWPLSCHFKKVAQAPRGGTIGVEKARAVKMVGDRAGVIGFLCHAP